MNIDVREYLRINPISAHVETTSNNENDCFMWFYDDDEYGSKYELMTQNQMFTRMFIDIFQALYDQNTEKLHELSDIGSPFHLTDSQFKKYNRKHLCPNSNLNYSTETSNGFIEDFENRLTELESNINDKIEDLMSNDLLNYNGCVEIMTNEYSDYNYLTKAIGLIWCMQQGQKMQIGQDRAGFEQVLTHYHDNTKAETTTIPYSTTYGGEIAGKFSLGVKSLVSVDFRRTNTTTNLGIVQQPTSNVINTPLYGLNILDWRYNLREHNNIPPSYNVLVKYKASDNSSRELLESFNIYETEQDQVFAKIQALYKSNFVPELEEEYTIENVSPSDLILRLAYENGDVGVYKQTMSDMISIFCEYGKRSISETRLEALLDKELTIVTDFAMWVNRMMTRLQNARNGIETIISLARSIKPRTYVGRIIVSTTDDTEKKVISKYGGNRWVRLVNFLRGVDGGIELGKKHGEEYVCLRTSNIPNHNHTVKNLVEGDEHTTEPVVSSGQGASSRLLNKQDESSVGDITQRSGINYQISPLECQSNTDITYPHNNMPPYKDVYMWECLSISANEYRIRYNMNGFGEVPESAKTSYTIDDLPYFPPNPNNPSQYVTFIKWNPEYIPEGTEGDFTFTAIWDVGEVPLTFDDNLIDVEFNDNTVDVNFDDNEPEIPTINDISVFKVDENDQPLDGAILELFVQPSNSLIWNNGGSSSSTIPGDILSVGTSYILRESVAPSGYTASSDTTIYISQDGSGPSRINITNSKIPEPPIDPPEPPDPPEEPEEPDIPDVPDIPDTPDTPDTPDIPDTPDNPEPVKVSLTLNNGNRTSIMPSGYHTTIKILDEVDSTQINLASVWSSLVENTPPAPNGYRFDGYAWDGFGEVRYNEGDPIIGNTIWSMWVKI